MLNLRKRKCAARDNDNTQIYITHMPSTPRGREYERQEVGNKSPVVSMFQTRQVVNELNKARETYNAILRKGKELGLDEAAQAESVRRSDHDKLEEWGETMASV